MLIRCKECNKEFSDKAECCPNCGCPISQMDFSNYCIVNKIPYDLSDVMELLPKVGDKDTDVSPFYIAGLIRRKTQLDWGSLKVKPIGTVERATSIIGLGILSKKINKTYKCLNCKYTW